MTDAEAKAASLALVARSTICLLGTNHPDGHPRVKAMLNTRHDGLDHIWLITNTGSKRVAQLLIDSRASLYYVDPERFMGLLLVGDATVRLDREAREMMWKPGYEVYYPQGIDDPDYAVLEFVARGGNYYHGLANADFILNS
jgi:general stress protein 26